MVCTNLIPFFETSNDFECVLRRNVGLWEVCGLLFMQISTNVRRTGEIAVQTVPAPIQLVVTIVLAILDTLEAASNVQVKVMLNLTFEG